MHSERFRPLLSSPGPYASVYFDVSHDTEDATAQIDLKWRALREELERQGAGPELIRPLEEAVTEMRPAIGRGARAMVATSDGVLLDEQLTRQAGTTVVRVSELPYLLPVVEHGVEHPSYLVVEVDHSGADIELRLGGVATTHTVEGGSYPVHKASGADTAGYGDPQPRAEESRSKNIRVAADRVTELVDDAAPEVVFVVGEVRSRNDLVAALPPRVTERLVQLQVGARRSGFDRHDLQNTIDKHLEQRRADATNRVAQRFSAEIGRKSGFATQGLPGVCAALRDGAVETLILGDVGDATVVTADDVATVAPNAEVLSELGAAPTHTLRADEALPAVAISVGADLIEAAEGKSPTDGVGAVLRYAPRTAAGVT
ncbi:Rv2629 family ribosome hibernation factor [Mycolicibacterium sp. XJ870]